MTTVSLLSFSLVLQEDTASNRIEILTNIPTRNILYGISVLVATYLLARLSRSLFEALGRKASGARSFFKLLATVFRIALWMIGGVIILSIFSPSNNTSLVLLALVGIVLGLGAQDLIKNIIGGLVILIDRPYQLGDRVKIGDAYGEIDHIGLRSTKLITPDDTRVTIPNGSILSGNAWNANSGVLDCLVVTDLFVPHDANPNEVIEIGYEAAYSSPFILLSKPVVVLLQDHFQDGPYMTVRVKAYVYDHHFEPRLQSDITQRAKAEFLRRGILQHWSGHSEGLSSDTAEIPEYAL